MTWRQRLRFLHWFALSDLYEPNAYRTTRVNRRSVALVTALSILAFGLAEGTREVRLAQFRANPMTLCLWIGDPNETARIDTRLQQEMSDALRRRLGPGFRAACPFQRLLYGWYLSDAAENRDTRSGTARDTLIEGRTLSADDPFLEGLKGHFVQGGPFTAPEHGGVIVTRRMLELLRLIPTETAEAPLKKAAVVYPKTLALRVFNAPDERKDVPVVGVIDLVLPNGQQFVVTAGYERRLRKEMAPIRAPRVQTGPVPADWPARSGLPPRVKDLLAGETYNILRLSRRARPEDGRPVWVVETGHASGLLIRTWRTFLEAVRAIMKEENLPDPPEFVSELKLLDATQEDADDPPAFRMAGVYLTDLPALEPAAALLRHDFQFPVNEEVIEQIKAIDKNSQQAMIASTVLALVLLTNGCSNMRVIQKLRAELKLTEIGMLKAMGMSHGLLRGLHLYEAWLVWRAGTIAGVLAGLAGGYSIHGLLGREGAAGVVLGFRCPWLFLMLVPIATGLCFLWSAVSGTSDARHASPIETLRTN